MRDYAEVEAYGVVVDYHATREDNGVPVLWDGWYTDRALAEQIRDELERRLSGASVHLVARLARRGAVADTQNTPVRAWLARARITDDPEGDFIADMRGERDLPYLFRNIEHMRTYLWLRGACFEAQAAVPGVWRRYDRWLSRHGMDWSSYLGGAAS